MAFSNSKLGRRLVAAWYHLDAVPRTPDTRRLWSDVRSRHPRFRVAVAADAKLTAGRRGERNEYRSSLDLALQVLRLSLVTESFFAQCCYRAKARCRALRIPFVPVLLDRLARSTGQISIGDPVVVEPGVCIPHGQVVVDGMTSVGRGVVISPFTTLGLLVGNVEGPTIEDHVMIGTGARVLGPVRVGRGATIGANAVVVRDVPARSVAAGVPARVISGR